MKRIIAAMLAAIMILGVFTSCGDGFKDDGELTYVLGSNVISLDPQTAKRSSEKIVINSIFEGLCRIDENGETVPGVADKWQGSSDDTQFTFFLRDAKWSEGQPVTADDFVYGIRRALDPATMATEIDELFIIKNAAKVNSGEYDFDSLGVYARDEKTLVFELEQSYSDFPALTAKTRFMPCNEEFFLGTGGQYGLECVYTMANGPFTFKTNYSWEKGDYIDLAKTNNYKGEHKVNPISLKLLMSDGENLGAEPIEALKAGTLDVMQISKGIVDEVESEGCEIKVLKDSVCGLIINPQATATTSGRNVPLSNLGLRELYMRSIDRNILTARLEAGVKEANSIMPPDITWNGHAYNTATDMFPTPDEFITDRIPSILSELEVEQVPSINIICLDDELSRSLATGVIVSWNTKLGNAFNLQPMEESEFNSAIANGTYQAAIYTMNSFGTLPVDILKQFTSTATPMLYENEEFDQQLKGAMFDVSIYYSLENFIKEQCIFYPIYYDETFYAQSTMTKGIVLQPDSNLNFSRAKKKEK